MAQAGTEVNVFFRLWMGIIRNTYKVTMYYATGNGGAGGEGRVGPPGGNGGNGGAGGSGHGGGRGGRGGLGARVVVNTFAAHIDVLMLLETNIAGGDGGAGGMVGEKGRGGRGGDAGPARQVRCFVSRRLTQSDLI